MSHPHNFKAGDRLVVKVGSGDLATSSGNGIEDGDIVTFIGLNGPGDCIKFRRVDQTIGSAWPARFELAPGTAPKGIKPDTQLGRVLALTNGQGAWTLAGIAAATGASEAAASARLRELRTHGYTVECTKAKGEAQRRYTVRAPAIALP